jgi:tetratricopeptide (TPR) repeat protein
MYETTTTSTGSSSSSASARSTELNNNAVAYWQSGYLSEAMTLFQMALAHLRDKCRNDITGDNGSSNSTTTNNARVNEENECKDGSCLASQAVESMDCLPLSHRISSRDGVPVWIEQDTHGYLHCYDRAILLNTDNPVYEDDPILSIVILFNIALLHHSTGLLDCARCDESLEQASRLYRLALGLLEQMECSHQNILLHLALLNNIAHIDSHLVRLDVMLESLRRMSAILTEDHTLRIDEEDYTIFAINVMIGEKSELTGLIAPAA